MRQRLTLLTAGYFIVIAIILIAVLPFVSSALRIAGAIQHQLGPANANSQAYLAAAIDQETGERGYLITSDERFLEPYSEGQATAASAYDALQKLHLDARERAALERAHAALVAWNTNVAAEISATRAGRASDAASLVKQGRSKALFDRFRAAEAQFSALVRSRLSGQRAELQRNSELAIVALLVASAVAAIWALWLRRWARASTEREERQLLELLSLSELHRLAASLAEPRSAQAVADAAVADVLPLLGAAIARMWVREGNDRVRLVAEKVLPPFDGGDIRVLSLDDPSPVADTLRERHARFYRTRDEAKAAYPNWASWWERQGAGGFALLPLRGDDDAFGLLLVFWAAPKDFDDHARTLLELAADNIGSAYTRASTREREHEAALKLQESLLGPSVLVEGAGHTVRYLPAETSLAVGGDWHNAQRLPDGRILIAVGDVVGRGIDAATTMGQLRAAVSASAPRCDTPADLLGSLDDFAHDLPGAQGTTVAFAYVDVYGERVEYLCAGHPPPLLVSPDGDVRLLDGALSWPLGIDEARPARLGTSTRLPAGSLLVMYSDGLIERRREPLDAGIERLVNSVEAHWALPLELLADAIVRDAFAGATREDDVALVLLRTPVVSSRLFLVKAPARPDSIRRVRAELRGWLNQLGLDPQEVTGILIAVGEACTNAVEHAYGLGGRALFRVEASRTGDDVICSVTDAGAWKDNPDRFARGNGIAIMRELMDEVAIEFGPGGTTVTLRYQPRSQHEPVVLA